MRKLMITAATIILAFGAASCGDDSSGPTTAAFGGGDEPSAEDILDDLTDGEFDESSLDDLKDNVEEMAESLGGSGSGTVEINGDTIDFESEICISSQGDFTIEGAGTGADGSPVWISISYSTESREEMAEFMDEELIATVYGDADPIIQSSIAVDYGRTEMFGAADENKPAFNASAGTVGTEEMTADVSGDTVSGSGSAVDYNYVAGEIDDRFDFTFEASCG